MILGDPRSWQHIGCQEARGSDREKALAAACVRRHATDPDDEAAILGALGIGGVAS